MRVYQRMPCRAARSRWKKLRHTALGRACTHQEREQQQQGRSDQIEPDEHGENRGNSRRRDLHGDEEPAPVDHVRYFTFLPEFLPGPLVRLLAPIERLLEASPLRVYSAHYLAVLRKATETAAGPA